MATCVQMLLLDFPWWSLFATCKSCVYFLLCGRLPDSNLRIVDNIPARQQLIVRDSTAVSHSTAINSMMVARRIKGRLSVVDSQGIVYFGFCSYASSIKEECLNHKLLILDTASSSLWHSQTESSSAHFLFSLRILVYIVLHSTSSFEVLCAFRCCQDSNQASSGATLVRDSCSIKASSKAFLMIQAKKEHVWAFQFWVPGCLPELAIRH